MGAYHVYTTDGLWVDTLFIDCNRYPDLGGVYRLAGENFSGYHFLNRDNGKVYVAITANAPAALYEVEGWTGTSNPTHPLPLQTTTVALTPEEIAPPAEQAASLRGITPARQAVLVRAGAGGPALDGSLTGWEQAVPLAFSSDPEQQVEVRPLYDADHIYLRFAVRLPRPVGTVPPTAPTVMSTTTTSCNMVSRCRCCRMTTKCSTSTRCRRPFRPAARCASPMPSCSTARRSAGGRSSRPARSFPQTPPFRPRRSTPALRR